MHPAGTMEATSTASIRTFPPLYVPTGEAAKDRLAFIHILERLKVHSKSNTFILFVLRILLQTQKRTGWVDHKV